MVSDKVLKGVGTRDGFVVGTSRILEERRRVLRKVTYTWVAILLAFTALVLATSSFQSPLPSGLYAAKRPRIQSTGKTGPSSG
jgi:hypothetical protein